MCIKRQLLNRLYSGGNTHKKVSVVPFNQVSADHAFKEGEDNRSLKKWREVHRKAFTPDYKAVGQDFDEKGDCVLEEFEVVYR